MLPNKKTPSLTFGLTPAISFMPFLAKEKYFFRDQRLDIDFREFLTGKKTMQALQKGWIDVGNVIDINVASLALEKKLKIKLLACTQIREDGQILARSDRHIKEPADLIGKKLGYMPRTSSHMFIDYFCHHYGIRLESIDLIPVRTDQMEKELLLGNIEACSLWQPFATNIRLAASRENIPITLLPNKGFFKFHVILGVTDKALKKRENDIQTILKTLKIATHFANENREATAHILAKTMKMEFRIFKQVQTEISFDITPIPDDFWAQVERQIHWIAPHTKINYEKFIDSLSFILSCRPENKTRFPMEERQ